MAIDKLEIRGFRGILAPFEFDLEGNSAVIYGKNGTGKSSITDAWEWFHQEEIEHLKREGAKHWAYPHCEAEKGQTYVKVYFEDKIMEEEITVEYNHDRPTKPNIYGNKESFNEIAPHPCHLRFNDLTNFVYYTKAEKYDTLARFMGFNSQVEFQKSLKRIGRKFEEKLNSWDKKKDIALENYLNHIDEDKIKSKKIITKINDLLDKWGFEKIKNYSELDGKLDEFRSQIENDPIAEKLSILNDIHKKIKSIDFNNKFYDNLEPFCSMLKKLLDKELSTYRMLSIDLFEC
ncbi:MAG: AAA family ATPase, partial [Candidatus Woesearchaeota archaeon]